MLNTANGNNKLCYQYANFDHAKYVKNTRLFKNMKICKVADCGEPIDKRRLYCNIHTNTHCKSLYCRAKIYNKQLCRTCYKKTQNDLCSFELCLKNKHPVLKTCMLHKYSLESICLVEDCIKGRLMYKNVCKYHDLYK